MCIFLPAVENILNFAFVLICFVLTLQFKIITQSLRWYEITSFSFGLFFFLLFYRFMYKYFFARKNCLKHCVYLNIVLIYIFAVYSWSECLKFTVEKLFQFMFAIFRLFFVWKLISGWSILLRYTKYNIVLIKNWKIHDERMNKYFHSTVITSSYNFQYSLMHPWDIISAVFAWHTL